MKLLIGLEGRRRKLVWARGWELKEGLLEGRLEVMEGRWEMIELEEGSCSIS